MPIVPWVLSQLNRRSQSDLELNVVQKKVTASACVSIQLWHWTSTIMLAEANQDAFPRIGHEDIVGHFAISRYWRVVTLYNFA